VRGLDGFPPTGRLSFFCDPLDWPWGARRDQALACVIFTEAPAERLQRKRSPQEFDEPAAIRVIPRGYVFRPRVLRPTARLLPPPLVAATLPRAWASPEWPARQAKQFWRDLYARNLESFSRLGEMIRQMGGTSFFIQEPVKAACVKFTEHRPNPNRRGRSDVHLHALTSEHLARVSEWQLVLQIDSDIEVGMEWGG
jgi:hypothetical protein